MTQQDVRLAFRVFTRQPVLLIVAVLTLALGVGASTAIFSVLDAVLLRALPCPGPDQLDLMFNVQRDSQTQSWASPTGTSRSTAATTGFSEMAGNTFHNLTLTGAGEPSIVNAADVTPEIFFVLRARPLAGRLLLPE